MTTAATPTSTIAATLGATAPARDAGIRSRLRRDLRTVVRQVRYDQRAFFRNRSRAFFSLALPLVFLVVFCAINGGHRFPVDGVTVAYSTWFVPGILAYGIMMTTFSNLAVSVSIQRDEGILKRLRGTPMPPWAYLAARVLGAVVTTSILVAATLGLGVVAYGVDVRTATLPGLLAGLVLGTVCFTSLGIAVTSVIRNADTAPAVVNVLILPLTFVSGIWMTLEGAPSWLTTVAGWFPVRALAHQLQTAFHPGTAGPGLVGRDLAVLAAWTVVGALVAARRFRWESARG